MASDVEIVNMALAHLGEGSITSLTQNSQPARIANTYWSTARDTVLRDFPWPFALRRASLAVVTDYSDSDDPYEWTYAYRYPADALRILRLETASGMRAPTATTRPRHDLISDTTGTLLRTDLEDAVLYYVARETNTERYPPDMVLALSYLLAALMAPSLTGGDSTALGPRHYTLYQLAIRNAWANALNEGTPQPDEPLSGFEEARA